VDSPQPTPEVPRDVLNEIVSRLDALENEAAANKDFQAALIGAFRAFLVVFGIRWLPDKPGGEDGER
jgi:hypothetical protein